MLIKLLFYAKESLGSGEKKTVNKTVSAFKLFINLYTVGNKRVGAVSGVWAV